MSGTPPRGTPRPEPDLQPPASDGIRLSRRAIISGAALLAVVAGFAGGALALILRDDEDERDGDQGEVVPQESPTDTPIPEDPPAEEQPKPTATPEEPAPPETEPTEAPAEETPEPSPTLEESTPTTEAATPSPETSPVPESPVWTAISPVGDIPPARRDHSLVADGEGARVYLFGGRDDEGDLDDLWVYEAEANSWTQLTADGGPAARFGHNAGFDPIRNQMIIFGGQAESTFFNDVWVYDVAGGVWSEQPGGEAAPEPRYGAAGSLLAPGDNLYISHGFTSSGRFDDTWFFQIDGGGWMDVSAAEGERPEPRCLMRMAADPDRRRLLMFGGQSDDTPFLGDFWEFNIESRLWNQPEASGPSARNLYSLVRRDDSSDLVLFGGASPEGALSDIWIFRSADNTWEQLDADAGPSPREGHDAAWLSAARSMLVFGGRTDDLTNELWILTLP